MLSSFDYVKPTNLNDALGYLKEYPDTHILAGGTDLLVVLRANAYDCKHVLDIKGIKELDVLTYKENEGLYIGALVKVNTICSDPIIRDKYPALADGADNLASYQLRNRATVIGNICNASPGADLSSPLLVYDAKVHIKSLDGERVVDLTEFFVGVKRTVLQPGEIVVGVSLKDVEADDYSAYFKQARVKGHDLAIAGAAVRCISGNQFKIAMNAVAPTPVRLYQLEEELNNHEIDDEAANWLESRVPDHIKPIDDVRSSKEYRLHISSVLVRRAFEEAINKGA